VTYLDTLLQTSLISEGRADNLRLPTRLRYLRIDPTRHARLVHTDVATGVRTVRVYTDADTQGLLAGGVEMIQLDAQTVQRRSGTIGKVGRRGWTLELRQLFAAVRGTHRIRSQQRDVLLATG
jgi:hypothetical protein